MVKSSLRKLPLGKGSVAVYPSSLNIATGSQRIFGAQLRQILKKHGLATENFDEALIVLVVKGYIRQFLDEHWSDVSRKKIVAANPGAELWRLSASEIQSIDSFLVGSNEEAWSLEHFEKQTFQVPFDELHFSQSKNHQPVMPLRLIYQGNREHLDQLTPAVVRGISMASEKEHIELSLVYDWETLGKARVKADCLVHHVQWSLHNLEDIILSHDVGLVPNLVSPPRNYLRKPLGGNPSSKAHRLEFKRTTNFGRALVFTRLGLPIIAEPTPSITNLIPNDSYGRVRATASGWRDAILEMSSVELRQRVADAAESRRQTLPEFDFEGNVLAALRGIAVRT